MRGDKSKGREFYKKMLAAKEAKANKEKRERKRPTDEAPKELPQQYMNVPKKEKPTIEVRDNTPAPQMQENTNLNSAIANALAHIKNQANGI